MNDSLPLKVRCAAWLACAVPALTIIWTVLYVVAEMPLHHHPGRELYRLFPRTAFVSALSLLPLARVSRTQGQLEYAYRWMRWAMVGFLASALLPVVDELTWIE